VILFEIKYWGREDEKGGQKEENVCIVAYSWKQVNKWLEGQPDITNNLLLIRGSVPVMTVLKEEEEQAKR